MQGKHAALRKPSLPSHSTDIIKQYIQAVIFGAPFTPTKTYLTSLPQGTPDAVYHGPTSFMPLTYDPYQAPKAMGIYGEIGQHAFSDVNAGDIVQRIMKSRERYEARQRAKGAQGGWGGGDAAEGESWWRSSGRRRRRGCARRRATIDFEISFCCLLSVAALSDR